MNYFFDKESIKLISNIFNSEPILINNCYKWIIKMRENMPELSISLFINVQPNNINLLSIQTQFGHYELHNIKCFNIFSNNEIAFFSEMSVTISIITINKDYGISFFTNIHKNILEKELSELDTALLLSSTQLSMYNHYK